MDAACQSGALFAGLILVPMSRVSPASHGRSTPSRSTRVEQRTRWPDRLLLVRHGESAGNVARDAAHAAGQARIDIAGRDADVPLSERGKVQSAALGRWL